MDDTLAIWNFIIAVLALFAAFYAIYQVRKGDNLRITITEAGYIKYNGYDKHLLHFLINNHSSKSLEFVRFGIFSDSQCQTPIKVYKDYEPHGIGWRESTSPFDLVMDITKPYQYEAIVYSNHVLHANTSFEARYYTEFEGHELFVKIDCDQRLAKFKKRIVIPIKLGSTQKKY